MYEIQIFALQHLSNIIQSKRHVESRFTFRIRTFILVLTIKDFQIFF